MSRTAAVGEGVKRGVPSGIPDGIPGGIAGGVPGGISQGVAPGAAGGISGGIEGGVKGGVEGFEKTSQSQVKSSHRPIAGGGGKAWYARGKELHEVGRYDEAIEAFQNAIAGGFREGAASYNIACGYARRGETGRALEWLARARDAGFGIESYLDEDEDLQSLRGLPAFQELHASREAKSSSRRNQATDVSREYAAMAADPETRGKDFYKVGKRLLSVGNYDLAARAFHQSADAGYRVGTSRYNEACARALAGDRARAMELLEQALLAGFDDPSLMRKDSDLASLHSERSFVETLGLADDLALPGFSSGDAKARTSLLAEEGGAFRRLCAGASGDRPRVVQPGLREDPDARGPRGDRGLRARAGSRVSQANDDVQPRVLLRAAR